MTIQKETLELIKDLHGKMDYMALAQSQITTALLGVEGTAVNGVAGDVKRNTKKINEVGRRVWMMIGGIVTLGAIAGILAGVGVFP